ncbi:hypothetical protein CC1G_03841 [Coprinopsis cinerea okayama7|uniref:NYN domain-containing protein n=1 Tax=Coprinopsis cinerea (strain Okayama-7 / 130 / ATCC MYA-4618 / FGSC 9003) TaxID=240176 RepID=A8NGX6_COPC7|nr:hypothetical protein CC1G_03841 [Coprinopsis cinerea okayama7\|eukprot:XP_001833624.2 hypothetical protein CC1G_03841 [Coprinopsis cinerea okayama7\
MAINPPPSTYVFISGDSDILYTASLLRMRGYKVVILCPEGSEADLLGEADWDDGQHRLFQRVWEESAKDQAAPGKSTSPMNTPLEAKPGIGIASGEDSYANRPIQPLAKTDDANCLVQDFPSAQSRDDSLHRRSLETVAENAGQGTWAPLVSSSASVLPRLQRPSSAPTSELSLPVYQDSTSPPWKVQEVGSDGWEGNVRSLLDSVRRGGTPAAWTRSAPTSDYGSRQAPSPGPSTMNPVLAVPSQSSSSKSSKEMPPRYKTLVDCLRGFATFSVPRGSLDGELRKIDPNFYANSGLSGVPRPMVNLIEGAYEEGIIASKTGPFVILTYPYRRV